MKRRHEDTSTIVNVLRQRPKPDLDAQQKLGQATFAKLMAAAKKQPASTPQPAVSYEYFNNTPEQTEKRVCYRCNRNQAVYACSHCEFVVCSNCIHPCSACQEPYCSGCSIIDYSHSSERVICRTCQYT
ncbi:hypothetical protein BCR43DRAFT_497566 [Syncephalastrum racemosum]|uniref:Uncharacterized protein n=1 Tax=Syncephalastrum racemosum TaxID=13706 RepID=A0A1X2H2D3_SYNRA|nr:hypothetical protein BCR43DRAFT_497566 [Syncephalastrum racemosum]